MSEHRSKVIKRTYLSCDHKLQCINANGNRMRNVHFWSITLTFKIDSDRVIMKLHANIQINDQLFNKLSQPVNTPQMPYPSTENKHMKTSTQLL